MAPSTRKLDRLAFQRLRESAERYGGFGGCRHFEGGVPCCVHGHAERLGVHVTTALMRAGIGVGSNDRAVAAVNRARWFGLGRFLLSPSRRIPFAAWCKALNVEASK